MTSEIVAKEFCVKFIRIFYALVCGEAEQKETGQYDDIAYLVANLPVGGNKPRNEYLKIINAL